MWRNFEIYVNLLTGSWMPWLDRNRRHAGFDHLLERLEPHTGGTPGEFFNALAGLLQDLWWPQPQKLMYELEQLSQIDSTAGCILTAEFLRLPASGSREQFYTTLTGFCLAGYDTRSLQLIQPDSGNEMGAYFHGRLLETLHNLIQLPVTAPEAADSELAVAYRVKAALCTLFHRLQRRQDIHCCNRHRRFPVRELLQAELAESRLDETSVRQIMHLFYALTGEKPSAQLIPAAPVSNPQPAPPVPVEKEPEISVMATILKEFGSEIHQMKQEIKTYLKNKTSPVTKAPPETNRRIDGVEARKLLGVSKTSLQRYRDQGKLPFAKVGQKYTYLESDVLKLIEKGKKINDSGKGKFRKPKL